MENSMKFLKKLKMGLPYDQVIPLLGRLFEGNKDTQDDICTLTFTEALFAIAKTWQVYRYAHAHTT